MCEGRKAKSTEQTNAPENQSRLESTHPQTKKKLSYIEVRGYATIEQRIARAEEVLRQRRNVAEARRNHSLQLLNALAFLGLVKKNNQSTWTVSTGILLCLTT